MAQVFADVERLAAETEGEIHQPQSADVRFTSSRFYV